MNYVQFNIEVLSEDDSDALVAWLEETNYIGCEQRDKELILFQVEASDNVKSTGEILRSMGRNFSTSILAAENWNKTWESNFEPVIIDNRIGIRAHFHEAFTQLPYEIIITPKMSFGTGHHATTQLMLSFMLDMDTNGKNVLDFGCGTGILAVFAKMRNAATVTGTDNDPWCIENSEENAKNNHCDVNFLLQDLKTIHGSFHLILANINLNILKENMRTMRNLLIPKGKILMSGVLESDMESLSASILEEGMRVKQSKIKNGWACLQVEKE